MKIHRELIAQKSFGITSLVASQHPDVEHEMPVWSRTRQEELTQAKDSRVRKFYEVGAGFDAAAFSSKVSWRNMLSSDSSWAAI